MDFKVVWTCGMVLLHGVLVVGSDVVSVSVTEGDSVTLHNNITITKEDTIRWYFNSDRIAEIDYSKTCIDVQCSEGTERFRGRLKLDNQTGSLTIMNTRITDSGEYTLRITRRGGDNEKIFIITVTVSEVPTTDKSKMGKDQEKQLDKSNPDSGLSVGDKARIGISVGVGVLLLVGATVAVFLCHESRTRHRHNEEYTEVQISHNQEMANMTSDENADPLVPANEILP